MDSNAPTWPGTYPSPTLNQPNQQPQWQPQYTPPPQEPVPPRPRQPRQPQIAPRVAQGIDLVLGIVEALLGLRVALLLLAANPTAGFSSWVYDVTAPLVAPFTGVFPNALGARGNYLDTAAMLAMIVYALAAWGLRALVRIFAR